MFFSGKFEKKSFSENCEKIFNSIFARGGGGNYCVNSGTPKFLLSLRLDFCIFPSTILFLSSPFAHFGFKEFVKENCLLKNIYFCFLRKTSMYSRKSNRGLSMWIEGLKYL
jgi:hypothetical protein